MGIKKGFTMTEVLIALSIVGVLSAIMIPAFYRSKPNQEMLMLKKSYYTISRAITELINDENFYNDTQGFADTVSVDYHEEVGISGNSKFCKLVAARMNVDGEVNCNSTRTFAQGGNFKTQDGAIWILPISNFASNPQIQVDVNGAGGDNCEASATCNKPDRFTFDIDRWGKITINDELTKKYLASTNTTATYKEIMKK